jgi:hypothetical protein
VDLEILLERKLVVGREKVFGDEWMVHIYMMGCANGRKTHILQTLLASGESGGERWNERLDASEDCGKKDPSKFTSNNHTLVNLSNL